MLSIQIIILFILWLIYACLDGVRDAYYWYSFNELPTLMKKNVYDRIKNIHDLFTWQRSVVAIMLCFSVLYLCHQSSIEYYSLFKTFFFSCSLALSFSIFHNGCYYCTRNNLEKDVYTLRFWDESTTSTSNLTFTKIERVTQFIISIVLLIISISL